ncbi:uncharacterized protein LOC141714883 [Apium graveolens]|uniref:uncharacterized protein LOC141714883 n=1 Tax=Apium graveolens TaxID=4045 RepID=UPI003D7B7DE2
MKWHVVGRTKDGKLRHSADAEGWKSMDASHPEFVAEIQNVHLGLAADGINPYRSMNISHNTWPVVLVNYNLPSWLVMKLENLIFSTLIPGPEYPGNDIDVYMQPLVVELKELWDVGLETYDAFADQTFMLHASLLWTISDFPGYALLSGWSTKDVPPPPLSGMDVEQLLFQYENCFGKRDSKKRKRETGTLLNIGGRTKDHLSARKDIKKMGIRKVLHPVRIGDSNQYKIRAAIFYMTKKEKELFCSIFQNVKLPHGTASNISRCVQIDLKTRGSSGFNEIDCFFRGLCGKVIGVRNRSKPEGSIAEGYLEEVCVTFCYRFLSDAIKTKIDQNINVGYSIGSRRNIDDKSVELAAEVWIKVHRYVFFNCGNADIEKLIGEHRILIESHGKSKRYAKERLHTIEFHHWLKDEVQKINEPSSELLNLARGLERAAKKYIGYIVNGFRFHTKKRDAKCTIQNGGVILTALTTSFASSKDKNPTVGDVTYYGAIEEIIEVDYWGAIMVVLFGWCWYEKDKDCYGITRVNFTKKVQNDDPYVLATQVQQVFYIQDCIEKNLHFGLKKLPKEYHDIGTNADVLEDVCGPTMHDTKVNIELQNQNDDGSWCRDDIPGEMCLQLSSGDEADDEIFE